MLGAINNMQEKKTKKLYSAFEFPLKQIISIASKDISHIVIQSQNIWVLDLAVASSSSRIAGNILVPHMKGMKLRKDKRKV